MRRSGASVGLVIRHHALATLVPKTGTEAVHDISLCKRAAMASDRRNWRTRERPGRNSKNHLPSFDGSMDWRSRQLPFQSLHDRAEFRPVTLLHGLIGLLEQHSGSLQRGLKRCAGHGRRRGSCRRR